MSIHTFSALNLPTFVTEQLTKLSLTQPTPIQSQAIPHALSGGDILASSQTGSGKTMAYLAPLVAHLLKNQQNKGLILLPTREIALQVRDVLTQLLGNRREFSVVLLIGGEPIAKQLAQLKRNPSLVIGTPGRICDHLERKTLNLQHTNFLVLDEVDRMLDMGFTKPLKRICQVLPQTRQTLMFSATLSPTAEQLAQQYLKNPKRITVTTALQSAPKITQDTVHAAVGEKMPFLLEQLQKQEGSVLIFVKTKRGAKDLAHKLERHNHRVGAIHGDLQQSKRTRIMKDFRLQNSRIMVATDIAARGLDVPHISLVINYDLPVCPEDYIHRIGRTGRAGATGRALSFITPHDTSKWKAITRLINPTAASSEPLSRGPNRKPMPQKGKSQLSQKNPWHKKGPSKRAHTHKPKKFSKARA